MKLTILFVCISLVLISCSKFPGGAGHGPTGPSELKTLTSVKVRDTVARSMRIDSFAYDSNKRLSRYVLLSFDTSSEGVSVSGRSEYVFAYNGSDPIPASFVTVPATDFHFLKYDNHGNLVADSVADLYHYRFSYGHDVIYTSLILFPDILYYDDTAQLVDGSITSDNYWNYTPVGTYHNLLNLTYTSYANPLHNSGRLGLLLNYLQNKRLDYVSSNLYASSNLNDNFLKTASWVSAGDHVISGTETFTESGVVHHVAISFQYQ